MTVYESNRREIKSSLLAISRAEASLKRARARLRAAVQKTYEDDGASYADIANVFIESGRPVTRQRIEQIMKGE